MGVKEKIIQPLYEIVIYVFPFFLLFFILVGFQMWKLEDTKEEMARRLENSNEIIEAARMEIYAMRKGLLTTTESFSNEVASPVINATLPDVNLADSKNLVLMELGVNVLKRVAELKNDSINYRFEKYVITEPTERYYAVVISYSELGYAIIQREYLISLGFGNVKILENDHFFALSIDDAKSKTDTRLSQAIQTWNQIFKGQSDGYIKKF